MRKAKWKSIFVVILLGLAGCSNSDSKVPAKTSASDANFDPCGSLREVNPHCGWKPHWNDSGVSVNAIDGARTEFLSLDSSDPDGFDAGRLRYAKLRVCLENGKLCRDKRIGVGVNVDGIVQSIDYERNYSSSVRLKFDDEKPVSQTWGIADSHDALFPQGREEQFLLRLLDHNKLVLEFSYFEKAPQTVTFEISGLEEKMKSIGVDAKAQAAERSREAPMRAKVTPRVGPCVDGVRNFRADEFCWYPEDGSGPWGGLPTRELAIRYAMDHYNDHPANR